MRVEPAKSVSAAVPACSRYIMRLINQQPGRAEKIILGALPFVLLGIAYAIGSNIRLSENPQDKLLPSLAQMADTFYGYAFEADRRSGDYLLWTDTAASLGRLLSGIVISACLAIALGVPAGFIPRARAALAPVIAAISLVPPITILPILFIIFGLGEVSKVVLIIVGTAPVMTRYLAQSVTELPQEQIIKAVTLGASTWQMVVRVVLPQIMPRLISCIRLSLAPAWIFLISAEAIASTDGLGYRIFLVRRYLAMDVILPYVAWITLIAFTLDRLLYLYSKHRHPWAHIEGGAL
jgi:NitT/TauT family transport system permease protein